MGQDSYMIKFICNFIPTIVFMVYFIILYKQQQEYNDYYKSECYINNVTYPVELIQSESESYWIQCSCGKRCRSVSPCLSIYTNDNSLHLRRSYADKNEDCTFYEDPCLDNENPLVLIDKMVQYIELGEEYQNSTVSCYKNKNSPNTEPIYLELKDVSTRLYIISRDLWVFYAYKYIFNNPSLLV